MPFNGRLTGITELVFPKYITTVGSGAFGNSSSFNKVYYTGTEEQWNSAKTGFGAGNDALINAEKVYNYVSEF